MKFFEITNLPKNQNDPDLIETYLRLERSKNT